MQRVLERILFAVLVIALVAVHSLAYTQAKKTKYKEIAVSNGGAISGVVLYKGPKPQVKMLKMTKDQNVCGETQPSEELVVNDGKLQWVVVSLDGITQGKPLPKKNILLNNKGCRFEPHVQGAVTKIKVDVMSQDPVLHNTHTYTGKRTLWNMAIPVQDKKIPKRLARRPGIVRVKCDAHEWMSGWIAVFAHPYYSTTGKDGTFTIDDIPAGTYTVNAWHESLGAMTKELTVEAGKTTKVNFEFASK